MPKPEKKISATEPGLVLPYSFSKARRIWSPVRFSPISTVKPSRFSSSATSRASLIGSRSGASASGYFALPMTSARRSPAAHDGTAEAAERSRERSSTRIFIAAAVQPKRRRSSLRRGDLTRRKGDYQTRLRDRQPLVASLLIATIHRDESSGGGGIFAACAQRIGWR